MKLVVQIPCLNEEATLPLVLKDIPKSIPGITEIVTLVIDDGSSDNTIAVAKKHGVTHFVKHKKTMGLAKSFKDGVAYALSIGADILVNTDGDNQYPGNKIGDLTQPIINGEAEIVIADRQTDTIEHFSKGKKFFQKFGTKILNLAAKTEVPDAPSGFRAYSRESLMRLNVVTDFSYAMETIIQAGNKKLAITSIPIVTNPKTRESRLFKSSFQHMRKSGSAIIRAFIMYRPYVLFMGFGGILFLLSLVPFVRYLILLLDDSTPGAHLQSLLLGVILMVGAFLSFALGVIADLIRINRSLIEENLYNSKQVRFNQQSANKTKK